MGRSETDVVMQSSPEEIWRKLFEELYQRIEQVFARSETRKRGKLYIEGLMSLVKRKNSWQLSEEIGEKNPHNLQYLVDRAVWDADQMRDILQEYVREKVGDDHGIGVLDETGFIKKGNKSVGVKRQYSGTAGRIENCQIGVFLSYSSIFGHTLIDRELYLPSDWCDDRERCEEAHIPKEVTFATKPELAIKMIKRAVDANIPMEWIAGDSVYGSSRKLRTFLEDIRKAYALAIKCNEQVIIEENPQRVDEIAAALAPNAWQVLSAGNGSKGPRLFRWALVPLCGREIAGWGYSLVIRQSLEVGEKAPDIAYILVFAPRGTSLQKMVTVIGGRWTVEECFEIGKGEVGLDEYEMRSWQGWYRHITFCMVAMAFLVVLRLSSQTLENSSEDRENQFPQIPESHESFHDPCIQTSLCNPLLMLVPFSVPEIQKLFYYLISFKPLSTFYRLAWSTWRRAHQALARIYHFRRRIFASPAYLQL